MNRKILLLALSVLLFFSCIRKPDNGYEYYEYNKDSSDNIVIGVSLLTLQLEYYVSYVQSMRRLANYYDVKLIVTDSMWNTDKQISDLREFIGKGVDAVICSPIEPESIKPILQEMEESGIAVIVEMTGVDGIYPTVCTDQKAGGRLAGIFAGEWILENHDGICDVAILDFPYFQNIRDRVEGFTEGLNELAPEARIVAKVDTKAKFETSEKAMSDLLLEYPEIRCVFAINDDSAKGANSVFENLGYPTDEICIIGFDADNGARKLIKNDRYLKASVAADTDMIANACINAAIKKISHESLPDWLEVKGAQYLFTTESTNTNTLYD